MGIKPSSTNSMQSTVWRGTLILLSVVAFIINCVCTAISDIPSISPWNRTIGSQSRRLPNGLSPASPAFKIWWFIYFINAAMCLYLVIILFRRHNGQPLFMSVKFIPNAFLYSFIIREARGPLWISLSTGGEILGTYLFLIIGALCLAVCLITAAKAMEECGPEMEHGGLKGDLWTMRLLVLNAIAVYLGWVSCASLVNNNTVLIYITGLSVQLASFISLGAFNAILVIWFILEIFIFDRQLRYTFTHYIPFIIATTFIYVKSYDPEEPYNIYNFVLMISSCCLALIKIVVMIVRTVKDPIHYTSPYDVESKMALSNMDEGYGN